MNRYTTKTGLLLLAGALTALPALAQTENAAPPTPPTDAQGPPPPHQGGPPRMDPARRAEHLQHALQLSPDQTAQVKAILESERVQADAIRTNTALSREDRHTQMMTDHQQTQAKIRALLTADQVSRFDAMEARMREHRDGPPPPDGGAAAAPGPGPAAR